MLTLYIVAGFTGLQGVLVAKSAREDYRQAQMGRTGLCIEIICARLLVLDCLLMVMFLSFNIPSVLALFGGWILAAIATLPLVMTGGMKVITAVKQKRLVWQKILGLVLTGLALLIYLALVFWMSTILLLVLAGEPYMGN